MSLPTTVTGPWTYDGPFPLPPAQSTSLSVGTQAPEYLESHSSAWDNGATASPAPTKIIANVSLFTVRNVRQP